MSTQKIKVRTANKSTAGIGVHLTLVRCENDIANQRIFGFAITDEGQECYVPANVIKMHQMTSADADAQAGFTAPIRPNPRAVGDSTTAQFVVTNPVRWDGEAEEIEIEVPDKPETDPEYVSDLENDISRFAEATDDMVLDAAKEIRDAMGKISNFDIKNAVRALGETADKLEAYRAYIDEVVPAKW